ncbi:MAG: hypothetical protein ACI9LM_000597 [Alteromonadaceae bacterium]|jgi:hypothetical protein
MWLDKSTEVLTKIDLSVNLSVLTDAQYLTLNISLPTTNAFHT